MFFSECGVGFKSGYKEGKAEKKPKCRAVDPFLAVHVNMLLTSPPGASRVPRPREVRIFLDVPFYFPAYTSYL